MDTALVHELVERVSVCSAGSHALKAALADCHRLTSWVEAQRLRIVSEMTNDGGVFVQQEVATAARSSLSDGERVSQRAGTVRLMPELGVALQSGAATPAHLDVVANGLRRVPADAQQRFVHHAPHLAGVASHSSVAKFRDYVDHLVRRLQADDGIELFERQRRAARLKTWTDPGTGMFCGRFQLDPETGQRLAGRIRRTVETLFHDAHPNTAPADAFERQEHFQALALVALTSAQGAATRGAVDMMVVADLDTLKNGLHERSSISCSGGAVLPVATVLRLACEANLIPAFMNSDGVVVHLGRKHRLASRHQRRFLRTMFSTCFVPDCDVPFEQCEIHHLEPFATHQRTDIELLRPTCHGHHHALHEGGWTIAIDGWNVTITTRDGATIRAGPQGARR
jgi:hypothetical protein